MDKRRNARRISARSEPGGAPNISHALLPSSNQSFILHRSTALAVRPPLQSLVEKLKIVGFVIPRAERAAVTVQYILRDSGVCSSTMKHPLKKNGPDNPHLWGLAWTGTSGPLLGLLWPYR